MKTMSEHEASGLLRAAQRLLDTMPAKSAEWANSADPGPGLPFTLQVDSGALRDLLAIIKDA